MERHAAFASKGVIVFLTHVSHEFSDLLVASFTQVKNLEELGQHGKLGAAELGEAGGKKMVKKSCA